MDQVTFLYDKEKKKKLLKKYPRRLADKLREASDKLLEAKE